TNTRAPSLREMINPDGIENGPFMHDGSLFTLEDVVDHYTSNLNNPQNTNLDPRLGGPPLNLTNDERNSLIAFLHTLSGTAVYTAEQWSDPFDENGELELIGGTVSLEEGNEEDKLKVFPNPFQEYFIVESSKTQFQLNIFDLSGKLVGQELLQSGQRVETSQLPKGAYILQLTDSSGNLETIKAIKN
ncbi:MAG: T9SS type A sorting domain-containing protein, partial [Bacteroidota bacterium]